jgi:transcription elongation factor
MRELPLNAKAYATLDENGNGTASTGPLSPGEQWTGITAAVSVATNVNEATCQLYAGAAATPGYLQGATTWGSTGNSGPIGAAVKVGGNLFAVWTGGDPGALATMTVTGTRTVA